MGSQTKWRTGRLEDLSYRSWILQVILYNLMIQKIITMVIHKRLKFSSCCLHWSGLCLKFSSKVLVLEVDTCSFIECCWVFLFLKLSLDTI